MRKSIYDGVENNYICEQDKIHFSKLFCCLISPLIIFTPYLIFDDFRNGYKKDAIMLLILDIVLLSIISGIIGIMLYL